jgi:hypothetical protein
MLKDKENKTTSSNFIVDMKITIAFEKYGKCACGNH